MSEATVPPPARRAAVPLRLDPVTLRLLGLLAAVVIVLLLLVGPRIFGGASIRSMAFQLPELGILSLAMMVPLLSGGLDLSIIATANLSALAMAYGFTQFGPAPAGVELFGYILPFLAGFAVAGVIGAVNGSVIAYLGVSPILATLGSMTLVKGIAVGLTHGGVISGFPAYVVFIGNGSVAGIPVVLLVFVLVAIPVSVLLTRTPIGNFISMIGSNERAVRFSGIDTRRVVMRIYLLSALLSAIAGVLMMARFNSANASYGESYLLVTILAAVLGGIDPAGGFGRVSGLVLALVILQMVSTAANLLNMSQFLSLALWGAILLAVAGVERLRAWFAPRLRRAVQPAAAGRR